MNNNISLTTDELVQINSLFIQGLKKQLNEFSSDIILFENPSPDESFLFSLRNYLSEVNQVSVSYKLFNIKKLNAVLLDVLNNIIKKNIFSNVFVKKIFEDAFSLITALNNNDKSITDDVINRFISLKEDIIRKNKIISEDKLKYDILKNRFDYPTYENIRNEYKNVLILLNRLNTLTNDIKKIKSISKNKNLKTEIDNNISTISNVAVSFQEFLNKVYYQPVSILFQKIETTLSRLEFEVDIKEYLDDIIIIPEIFLFLYNDFSEALLKLKSITKEMKIEILISDFNDDIELTFIFKNAKRYYTKLKDLFSQVEKKNKFEFLLFNFFHNTNDLVLKIKFQNVIFYL